MYITYNQNLIIVHISLGWGSSVSSARTRTYVPLGRAGQLQIRDFLPFVLRHSLGLDLCCDSEGAILDTVMVYLAFYTHSEWLRWVEGVGREKS